VLDKLVSDGADKTADAIAAELRRVFRRPGPGDPKNESDQSITAIDADRQLTPDTLREVRALREELSPHVETDPRVPMDPQIVAAFQAVTDGVLQAFSSELGREQAAALAMYVRNRVADEALTGFPPVTYAHALREILSSPVAGTAV
jgi:hypothetical protein